MIIRFGYCPPSPGPNKKNNCKWYTNIDDALNDYDGHSEIWVKFGNKRYRQIDYRELIDMI